MNEKAVSQNFIWGKIFAIFLITIPLFLMGLYQPLESNFLNIFKIKGWGQGTLNDSFQDISKSIDETIKHIKVNVSQKQVHTQCRRFTKLSSQKEYKLSKLFNSTQFCDQPIDRFFQQIYVTIIFQKNSGNSLKSKWAQWGQKIKAETGIEVKIIEEILDLSILPQHIKDKINDSFYLNTIATEFSNLKYLKHCRFSYRKCQNLAMIVFDWDILKDRYYEVGQVFFSHPLNFELTLLQILTQGVISLSNWKNIIKIRNLQSVKKELNNIEELHSKYMIQFNQDSLKQNLKQIQYYIANGTQLPPSLLQNEETVVIDLFPSEYKVGIYLPIILIMIIFPCFSVLKI